MELELLVMQFVGNVRIEPLKAWHNVIDLEFIIYLMMFQFHFYLSLFHVLLYKHFCLHLLHCMWLRCIRSCTKDLSHEFLENRWLIHNQFLGLGNLLKVVVHHFLIGGMVGLGYWDKFSMMSHYKENVKRWRFLNVKIDIRWRFSKASYFRLSYYKLPFVDAF